MKKLFALLLAVLMLTACTAQQSCPECEVCPEPEVVEVGDPELPAPRLDSCDVNDFSTDCSSIKIGENLHEYLGRDDVVYLDLRDFADYAKTHINNFECIPYFALIRGMGEETEAGVQLYYGTLDDPKAAYAESEEMLKALIPADKTVFLMCQSGGRVAQCMQVMQAAGYDMSKVYNVGGMAQTDANKNLSIVSTQEVVAEVNYNFEGLTPAN